MRERAPEAFLVDAQPPFAGLVRDGLPLRGEVDFTPSNATFAGNWRWWQDRESGIHHYDAALGTTPGGDDAYGWTSVGLETSVFFSLFGENQLHHGVKYFLSVRAVDNAGHSTVASSDGVVVDRTAPDVGSVVHGLADIPVRKYASRTDLVVMMWNGIHDGEVRSFGTRACPCERLTLVGATVWGRAV